MTRPAGGLRALVVLATALIATVLMPARADATFLATRIVFTSITTPGVDLPETEGAPGIFVTEDRDFTVTAEFQDDSGVKRAAVFFPATARLYVDGSPTPFATKSVPASATSVTFTGLRLPEQNDIRLRMTLTSYFGLIPLREGVSDQFDVQRASIIVPFDSNPTGIGGGGGQGEDTACTPTVAEPVCGDLVLSKPSGVLSDQIGSVGFCQAAECLTDEYLQAIVDLNPSVYNRSFPMRIIVKCHPSLCDAIVADKHKNTTGGGHHSSSGKGHSEVSHLVLVASKLADGALAVSPACQQSGKVGSTQPFCTDYAASFKAYNGVWTIVWLSPGDARVSFPK